MPYSSNGSGEEVSEQDSEQERMRRKKIREGRRKTLTKARGEQREEKRPGEEKTDLYKPESEGEDEGNCWSHPHLSKPVEYPTNRDDPNYGLRRITQKDSIKLREHRDRLSHGSLWPPEEFARWQRLWQ